MDKKPLYLANNYEDLKKLAEMRLLDTKNVQNACTLLNKLYGKYEEANIGHDEELAYLFMIRFLENYNQARKLFPNDLKYINALIKNSNVSRGIDRAEILKCTLKDRYEKKKTVGNKIKEDVIPVVDPGSDKNIDIVTCKELYKILKGRPDHVLIVDTRPRVDYDLCRIKLDGVVNIPCQQLPMGCSIDDVNGLIKKHGDEKQNKIWQERASATLVIILDWNMTDQGGVNVVKDAIYKWTAEKTIKEPVLLDGGLQSFLLHYPTMVTDPQYKGPSDDTEYSSVDPAGIKYPNWNTIEEERRRLEEEALANDISEICDKDLMERFKGLRKTLDRPNPQGPSLIIDRSLKPDLSGTASVSDVKKDVSKIVVPAFVSPKVDRALKPETKKEASEETNPVVTQDYSDHPKQIRRLSSNSRTDQDRNNFTAKGGAKSIAPPPEPDKIKLPSWMSRELDSRTNEYIYIDRRKDKRNATLPDEFSGTQRKTVVHVDQVEALKDHTSKQLPATSTMKRSTSQPNLSDEITVAVSSDFKDNTNPGCSQASQDPPPLDRLTKPVHTKTFNDFSASRLSSFSPTYRSVIPSQTGLRNMGNTCYMNSVIQALSNTKFLARYILSGNYQRHINKNNPLGYRGELVIEFALLTKALWKGQYKDIFPADFKKMVDSKNEMFRGAEQHDSQEFLLFLLDGLHEDLNSGTRHAKVEQPSDTDQVSDADRAKASWNAHLAINDSVIVDMFQGQYRSKVTCDHCLVSSVTFDAFMYLSLPLVTTHSRCTLDECIKLFLAEERMTGASQWSCPKCKTNRNARKKIDIWKLPPYLLIHLKRFSCSGQYRQKLNTFVDFPMENLSLSDTLCHTTQSHKNDSYHLYAVSNHHGNMESGHYTSYCKDMTEGRWHNFDDDVVTPIKESEVKTPSAYILFYERQDIKQTPLKN